MDKCIGELEIDREGDAETTKHKLVDFPEYKNGVLGEKIMLFSCINRTGANCYIALSVADTTGNNAQAIEIMKRIKALKPFDDKCQLSIKVKLFNSVTYDAIKISVGLTSDLTSSYDYEFLRNKEK